jgi:hypothetical protein
MVYQRFSRGDFNCSALAWADSRLTDPLAIQLRIGTRPKKFSAMACFNSRSRFLVNTASTQIISECCSGSSRNRVHLAPDSPTSPA